MPTEINNVTFYSTSEVTREIGVSRQTLWRWRQDGFVPAGRRYRGRQVLFNTREVDAIREYANRLEPLPRGTSSQLRLFDSQGRVVDDAS